MPSSLGTGIWTFFSSARRTWPKLPNEHEHEQEAAAAACEKLKRNFIVVVLLLSCVILGILLPWHRDGDNDDASSKPESVVPQIPWTKVTFERNENFAAPSSPESDAAWGEMMPPGDGFVVVDHFINHLLLLPQPQPGKETRYGQVYDISMWHQLHCLSHMRSYMYTMQASLNRTNAQQVFDVLLKPQADHILHCFDYLRQAVMCAGDMTLEWPRTEPDGRRFAVDGWGIEHQCRDWDVMADFVEKHAVGRHHEGVARGM